jgi:hypothetical protein
MIILAGKVHISTWYNDSENRLPRDWVVGLSTTGWTNDVLGLRWLRDVFDKHTVENVI